MLPKNHLEKIFKGSEQMIDAPNYTYLRSADVETERIGDEYYFKKIKDAAEYQPFDYYESQDKNLYIQFSKLDENDIDSIAEFIKQYGFLGTKVLKRDVSREPVPYYETLSDWKLEIYRIRLILKIYAAISGKKDSFTDFVIMHTYLDNVANLQEILSKYGQANSAEYAFLEEIKTYHALRKNKDLRRDKKFLDENLKDIKNAMLSYMQHVINEKTENVRHCIWLARNIKGLDYNSFDYVDWDEYVVVNTLLEAIYAMLYQDLLRGKRFIICKVCGNYFRLEKGERLREWCKPECGKKLHYQNYDKKINSDVALKEYDRIYNMMDARKRTTGKKAITFEEWERFREEAKLKKDAYKKGLLSKEDFLNWLKQYK